MKVLIAGGGTAGHINPGLAIAKYIKSKNENDKILFVGTEKGLENTLVPRDGFDLSIIRSKGFRRKIGMDTLKSVKMIFDGIFDANKIIKEFKPDIVIGTGGYVCGPVLFVASRKKIPTLIHESNSFPGITNRILSRFVDSVAISFNDSKRYFNSSKKLVLTGNPIRKEMFNIDKGNAKELTGVKNEKPTVVIFGGSRGAEKINDAVKDMIESSYKEGEFNLIFATGDKHYEEINKKLEPFKCSTLHIVPYIYDMANIMGAADLVVSRAGAITISELAALGVPSILIPSPYVTANHQEHNAREFEVNGASVVVLEKDLSSDILYTQICSLIFQNEQLLKMAKNAKKIGKVDATEKIYSIINEILRKSKK